MALDPKDRRDSEIKGDTEDNILRQKKGNSVVT